MYGDGHQHRASTAWTNPGHDRTRSGDSSYSGAGASVRQRASLASSSRLSSDLAYYTPEPEPEPAPPPTTERSAVSRRFSRTSAQRLSAVDHELGPHKAPMTVNGKPVPARVSLHSIKVSLDSEGTDGTTYNQFEAVGVRGDGYEVGVDRIRSHTGTSRVSQLQAEDAEQDRTRSVDARELTRDRSEVGSPRASLATASSLRAPSSHAAPSSSRHTPSDLFDSAPASAVRRSDLSASSYAPAPSLTAKRRSGSPPSRRSSRSSPHRLSAADHELPPLPPSIQSHRSHSPSPTPPPENQPPRQPSPSSPSPAPVHLSPEQPVRLTWKHPPSNIGSPSSKISLVPSEGEDMDGFHVRNTYAQLEASGVKGDGYEEGVERTRARIGTSRTSQLQAEEALGDGQEKKRNLDPREIQLLQSVDR